MEPTACPQPLCRALDGALRRRDGTSRSGLKVLYRSYTRFVIGPIIAALFVTVWDLYGYEFREWLPTTAFRPRSGPVELPHKRLEQISGKNTRDLESEPPPNEREPSVGADPEAEGGRRPGRG